MVTSDECIKMRNEKNVFWHFIHQSIKVDAMSKSKREYVATYFWNSVTSPSLELRISKCSLTFYTTYYYEIYTLQRVFQRHSDNFFSPFTAIPNQFVREGSRTHITQR